VRQSRPRFSRRARATDGLLVKVSEYAESSAVVTLLTGGLGLVHAVAKGAKRLSNSFKGPLDKGVLYRVRVGRRGREGLYLLNSATVREAFPALRRESARFHAASLVLEVASDLTREGEPHVELFRLTVFVLKALDRAPSSRLGLVASLFLARAVVLSGHAPEIGHCVACGRPLRSGERPLLAPLRGGLLHPACAQGEPGARQVGAATLACLEDLWETPAAEILAAEPYAPETLRKVRRLLEDWLQQVLERRFMAAEPMEREIARDLR